MAFIRDSDLESKIKLACEGHYYIKVNNNEGKFKTTHISIKGCQKMWEKDNDFIYVPKLRHAGRYEDLLTYFGSKNYDEEKMAEHLKDAYTIDNYQSLEDQLEKEISKIPETAKIRQTVRPDISVKSMLSMGKSLKTYTFADKKKPTSPVPVTPKASAFGGKKDLRVRLEKIKENEVLDVSNFNPETKKGIKKMKKPTKKTTKSPVGNSGDLKRLYYDFAKPVENGIAALIFLGFKKDRAEKIMNDPIHTTPVDPSSIILNH
jgi:hypothetical protein